MIIAVLGTGSVGTNLGTLFLAHGGHDVVYGSRDAESAASRVPAGARTASYVDASAQADAVLIATPWITANGTNATLEMLSLVAAHVAGKVVIDATNPLNPDWSPATSGADSLGGGEQVASALPGARVVKAFNTVFADVMAIENRPGAAELAAFYCGDDDAAKKTVASLASKIGFDPVDAGNLRNCRYLEAMASLNIAVAGLRGERGTRAAFVYAR